MTEWARFPGATYVELDGDADLFPGISVLATPGHTVGHQAVVVETDDGRVVLGGDVTYSMRELIDGATRFDPPHPRPATAPRLSGASRAAVGAGVRLTVDAFIVDAVRSPIGRKRGTLSAIRGDDLAAQVLNGLIAPHDLDPAEIEDVQMGCVTQIGEQGWNVGRMAVLAAGWPVDVSATTVDRQCGSSMQTNFNGAAAVLAGQLDLVVSAGVEMMSRVPMGSNGGSISEQVTDRYDIVMQGTSAELLAREWNLSREALDAYSLESHRRALAASDGGKFEREIVPITLPRARPRPSRLAGSPHGVGGPRWSTRLCFAVDEAPRRETTAEALAALQPAFDPAGVITAGNSSQIVDGAAAVLIASESAVERLGLSHARASSRSASPASTRRGCCTATRRRCRRRSRRRA